MKCPHERGPIGCAQDCESLRAELAAVKQERDALEKLSSARCVSCPSIMARAEKAEQEAAKAVAERDEALAHYEHAYETLKEFDVYGTDGDATSCAREVKMQLSEARTGIRELRAERDTLRAALEKAAGDIGLAAELLRRPKHPHSRAENALTVLDAALADARRALGGEK